MRDKIKILEVAYHRNGVCGNGFSVVLFDFLAGGETSPRKMVGIVFEERGNCAVLDANETAKGNIAFANGNSWRGDHFEADLREAIEKDLERING